MRKLVKISLAFLLVVIFSGLANAQTGDYVDYTIVDGEVFVELGLESSLNTSVRLPKDAKSLELNTDSYILESFEDYKLVKVDQGALRINYITKNFIDKAGKSNFFVIENHFDESIRVRVLLPESAILSEPSIVFPNEHEITTDGRRVILIFEDFNEEQILVKYEFIRNGNSIYFILLIILLAFGIVFYLSYKKVVKRKSREIRKETKIIKNKEKKEYDLTRNLFEDEKKIVEFLLKKKNKECWTKEIVRNLEISKVKLSRKLRSLEQKGIIKKIPYGNENIIRLLTYSQRH